MRKRLIWVPVAIVLVILGFAANTARQAAQLSFTVDTPDQRLEKLSEHWRILRPGGEPPFPAAILLSGCDGVHDNMDYWAEQMVSQGRAAIILDSHAPRRLDKFDAWRLVCSAQALTGAERAGDIAVTLQAISAMDDISDDVVLFGASHGGWTVMEFISLAMTGETPPGLSDWPAPADVLLRSLDGLILLYPYCGVMNGVRPERWADGLPSLMILAEHDTIIRTQACVELADRLRSAGAEIETRIIAGANHGFDQKERSPMSSLVFNEQQRDEAQTAVTAFLAEIATAGQGAGN